MTNLNIKNNITQRGMGLLQLLFVLGLAALLLTGTMLYWQSVQRTQLVTSAEQLLNNIIEAAQGWEPDNLDQGKYDGISAIELVNQGGIAEAYITVSDNGQGQTAPSGITTPWKGASNVIAGQDSDSPGILHITFQHIPDYACETIKQHINNGSLLMHTGGQALDDDEHPMTSEDAVTTVTDNAKCTDDGSADSATLDVWYYPDD